PAIALAPGGPGRAIGRGTVVFVVPAVFHPLPHVAVHVVQAEVIGREGSHRSSVGIPVIAGHDRPSTRTGNALLEALIRPVAVPAQGILIVTEMIARCRSGARRVFPFGLAEQPVLLTGLPRQPLDIGLRIVPVETGHGVRLALRETGIAPGKALSPLPFAAF